MKNDEKKKAFAMLVDGATYQEVADELGVSKQYVHQELGVYFDKRFIRVKCIYEGIENFLLRNKMSIPTFSKNIGVNLAHLYKILRGENGISKSNIDKILKFTGMTYEEAFKEKEK